MEGVRAKEEQAVALAKRQPQEFPNKPTVSIRHGIFSMDSSQLHA